MFKGIFGKGKKDEKKSGNARKKKENRKSRKMRKAERKSRKIVQPKAGGSDPLPSKAVKDVSVETKEKEIRTEGKSSPLELRHRRKKGKRPVFKKVPRPKPARKKGTVTRSGDEFYPGDSDFKYTSPKEIWVPCLGQKLQSIDLGDEARLLPDPSIAVTQKKLQM